MQCYVPPPAYPNQPPQAPVLRVYELLSDGQCLEWKTPPLFDDGFRFWSVTVDDISKLNFIRPSDEIAPVEPPKVPQEVLDQLAAAGLTEQDAANSMLEGNQYV